MEINSQVNTFLEGMNLDSDITMLSDKQYRWAQNVRLLTDNAGTTGILQNIEDIRQYLGGLEISEIYQVQLLVDGIIQIKKSRRMWNSIY